MINMVQFLGAPEVKKTSPAVMADSKAKVSGSETKKSSFKDDLAEASNNKAVEAKKTPDNKNKDVSDTPAADKKQQVEEKKQPDKIEASEPAKPEEKQEQETEKVDQSENKDGQSINELLAYLNGLLSEQKTTDNTPTPDKELLQKVQNLLAKLNSKDININQSGQEKISKLLDSIKNLIQESKDSSNGIDFKQLLSLKQQLNEIVIEVQKLEFKTIEASNLKINTKNLERFQAVDDNKETIVNEGKQVKQQQNATEQAEVPKNTEPVKSNTEKSTVSMGTKEGVESEVKSEVSIDKPVEEKESAAPIKQEADTKNEKAQELLPKTKENANSQVDINSIKAAPAQAEKNFEVISNIKIEKPVVLSKTEIVDQIVKKASVIIKDTQSEINMKLEPESLGKLSMKLVVERGLMTAKFVAESQQVKEVIETNFNQLKDMLNEKGISVQSFSVSVGQDNSRGYENPNFNQWRETLRSNRGGFKAAELIDAGSYETKLSNPYSYHEGKIDYRA